MSKSPNIKIFVAHHKPGLIYGDDIFVPIHVGKKNSRYDLGILGDDTGDNISHKNNGYCELTAQYWVWKNYDLSDVDYVGFCHYRRYMGFGYIPKPYFPFNAFKKNDNLYRETISFLYYILGIEYELNISNSSLIDVSDRTKKFFSNNKFDIVLPRKSFVLRKPYYHLNIQNDKAWEVMEHIFAQKFPLYYKSFNKLSNSLLCGFGNIFIMKKELFIEYSKFQFGLLFEFEKEIRNKGMGNEAIGNGTRGINTRVMGYISERFPWIFAEYQKSKGKKIDSSSGLLFFL